jgi:transposase InsO family protein
MWGLSKLFTTSRKTFGRDTNDTSDMATPKMRCGPCWLSATLARGNRFAVVTIEYSTRWIEAKLLASITSDAVKKFFWQNIICRFGVPRILIVDNGKQFDSDKFKEFCTSIGTKLAFALVYHPKSNGAVE